MTAPVGVPAAGGAAPVQDPGALVDALRRAPGGRERLAALLPENLPIHTNRSAAETSRLRGYLLAAFAETGLPDSAVPYVIESLETADVPYEIAGAALALRGLGDLVGDDPSVDVDAPLVRAVRALAGSDATVSFESYRPTWPYALPTTALTEVVRTIGRLGPRAAGARAELAVLARQRDGLPRHILAEIDAVLDRAGAGGTLMPVTAAGRPSCCGRPPPPGPADDNEGPPAAVLEDQDGRQEAFAEFFTGKPAVVAFFYTRCDNPYKCSRTITTLAALQRSLAERGLEDAVKVAAITYDPEFDLPDRLRVYGHDRGVRFGAGARFFRVVRGFPEFRRRFDLGVNYGASTVNRHRVEVYVLDARGAVAASFTRVQWEAGTVLGVVENLLREARQG